MTSTNNPNDYNTCNYREDSNRQECPVCFENFLGDEPAFLHHVDSHFTESDQIPTSQYDSGASTSLLATSTINRNDNAIDKSSESSNNHASNNDALLSHCPVCQMVLKGPADERELHIEFHFTTSRTEQEPLAPASTSHLCSYCGKLVSNDEWSAHKDLHVAQTLQHDINDDNDDTAAATLMVGNTNELVDIAMNSMEEQETTNTPTTFCNIQRYQTNVTLGVLNIMKERLEGRANLCDTSISHIVSGVPDRRWGCGYRNIQMFMSVLTRQYPDRIARVMEVVEIQRCIEQAWQNGWDTAGAQQLGYRLQDTGQWIGATEVYTFFSSLGIKCHIIDFHQPTGVHRQHTAIFQVVREYYTTDSTSMTLGTVDHSIYLTGKPPLYLQHQGHSRTIVGIEQLTNGTQYLLLFDPNMPVPMDLNRRSRRWLHTFRCDLQQLSRYSQYQLLYIDPQATVTTNDHVIRSVRIP